MSSKNPYELRFSMFTEAKGMLQEEWYAEKNDIMEKFHAETEQGLKPAFPIMRKFPTFREVESMARDINTFVSNP